MGGVLAAALLGSACGEITRQGGADQDDPPRNFFGAMRVPDEQIRASQRSVNRGYNGTIDDVGSSIDPRTPETQGTPGRSLPEDLAWKRAGQRGQGGAGSASPSGKQ